MKRHSQELPLSVRCSAKVEQRNLNPETLAVRPLHEVVSFHCTLKRFENTEAVVLVGRAGLEVRLLTNDTLALKLLHPPGLLTNVPVPPQELHLARPVVLDTYEVTECKPMIEEIGLLVQIDGTDRYGDVGRSGVIGDHSRTPKVT